MTAIIIAITAGYKPEKKNDAMAWTRHMNMLKAMAEEAVVREIIYSI